MDRKGVFKITNKQSGKVYIGSSNTNLNQRMIDYLEKLESGTFHNKQLQEDFKYYGIYGFTLEIVAYCKTKSELIKKRDEQIALHKNNNYNITYNIPSKGNHRPPTNNTNNQSKEDETPIYYLLLDKLEEYPEKAVKLEKEGKYEQAIKYYNRLIELNPTKDEYYISKIFCLIKLGSYDDIIECCDRAIQLDSKNQVIKDKLNYLILLERYEKLLKIQSNNAAYYFNKAECLYNLVMYEKALPYYNKAIKLLPHISRYYFSKAKCLEKLEKYSEAIKSYDKSIQTNSSSMPESHYSKAKCFEKLGQYEKAITAIRKSIDLDPWPDHDKNKTILLQKYEQIIKTKKKMNK